jgi:diguanylate cyclase (GGDEF)-like protein/PAS domain S-box-containing protein
MNDDVTIKEQLRAKGFGTVNIGLCITDEQGNFVEVNNAYCDLYGYTRDELIGEHFTIVVPEGKKQKAEKLYSESLIEGREIPFEWEVETKEGIRIPIFATANVISLENGTRYKITSVTDMREHLKHETRQLLSEKVFTNSREGILITDANMHFLQVNPALLKMTGYREEELIGRTPHMFQSGRTDSSKYRDMWNTIARDGYWQGELWDRKKNGELFAIMLSITEIKNDAGKVTHYLGIMNEITEQKRYLQQIYDLAYFDTLTQMPNRALFDDRCEQAVKKAKREQNKLAILFIDIDRFTSINNTFGHKVGDELIQKVATRLKNNLREVDTISHFSGDKFVVLLENLNESRDASPVAEKLLRVFSQPFQLQSQEIFITAGIGISVFPDDGTTNQVLMQNAESAVHKAKESGKSRYQFYSKEINARSFEKLLLENNLRGAITNNELFLMYQPQIKTHDKQVSGMEVLVRWKHAELGLVSPGQFIPLAEETGLILPLGEWIIREACKQYMKWSDQGLPQKVLAINLSAVQFTQHNLAETVQSILKETGFPPGKLEFEITETAIMDDVESSLLILDRLRSLGISISIDDFGTGYSSLSYLRKLSIRNLKIDQSFIAEVEHKPEDATIVSAILSLAKGLGLEVIAEGVETVEQLTFLEEKECEYVQGYYFSPPLTTENMELVLRSGSLSTQ